MCQKCEVLQKELNKMRGAIAREAIGLEYTRPDTAAAYSCVIQKIDAILRQAEMKADRVGGFGFTWAMSSIPLPMWDVNKL